MVGVQATKVSEYVANCPTSISKKSSVYRPGYSYLELENVPGGVYNIQPATYTPHTEGQFFLTISSSAKITVSRLW